MSRGISVCVWGGLGTIFLQGVGGREPLRNPESQAPPQSSRTRIISIIRSPDDSYSYEKLASLTPPHLGLGRLPASSPTPPSLSLPDTECLPLVTHYPTCFLRIICHIVIFRTLQSPRPGAMHCCLTVPSKKPGDVQQVLNKYFLNKRMDEPGQIKV